MDFKALKRLTLVYSVNFILELVKDPRHLSFEGLSIVQFKIFASKDLNLTQFNVNFFFRECVVVIIIHFNNEFVFGRRQIVGPHL